MIQPQQAGLRKAAILVAALDRAAADEVLDRMDPDQAQRVRQTILELGPVDPEEQRHVDRRVPPRGTDGSAATLGHRAGRAPRPAIGRWVVPRGRSAGASGGGEPARPFRFLRQAECDQIARLLVGRTAADDRPGVVPSRRRSRPVGCWSLLAPATQVEVVRRLVDLEETDPEVLREVEHALQSRLAERVPMQRRRVAGASAVSGILRASEQSVGRRILDNLATHDERLAEQFASEAPYGRGLSRFLPRDGSDAADSRFRGENGTVPLASALASGDPLTFDDLIESERPGAGDGDRRVGAGVVGVGVGRGPGGGDRADAPAASAARGPIGSPRAGEPRSHPTQRRRGGAAATGRGGEGAGRRRATSNWRREAIRSG